MKTSTESQLPDFELHLTTGILTDDQGGEQYVELVHVICSRCGMDDWQRRDWLDEVARDGYPRPCKWCFKMSWVPKLK